MSPPKTPSPGIAIPSYNDYMGEAYMGGTQSSSSLESSSMYKGALHLTAETEAEFGVTKLSPNSASRAITRVENTSDYAQFSACRSQLENSSNDSLQGLVLLHSQPYLDNTDQQYQPHPDYNKQGAHPQNWNEQHYQTIQPQAWSEYVERNSQRHIEDTTGDSSLVARFDSVTRKNGTTTADLTQQLEADTLSTPKQTNAVLPQSDDSLSYLPRSAMGYMNPTRSEHNPWTGTLNGAAKMDRESEGKEHESDGHSAASTASATTASPIYSAMETARYPDALTMSSGSRGQLPVSAFGTPSTVSTVPSTDDVSVEGLIDPPSFERLTFKMDETDRTSPRISPRPHRYRSPGSEHRSRHNRSMSWEHDGNGTHTISNQAHNQWGQGSPRTSPSHGPMQHNRHVDPWSVGPGGNVQVASFRGDQQHQQMGEQNGQQHYGYPEVPHSDAWRQQRRYADPQQYYMSQQMAHLPPSGQYHHTRKGAPNPPMTPPRSTRQARPNQSRQSSPQVANSAPTASTNPPRSSSEVLKTLLRKKACLYEPDTSKAVALVTWLVGRELALEYGYFSRQQLQSGVHACVANKIDSGAITRTKVNRCMQIILNSCFHYIIPRPDGSEENGDAFRKQFADTALDDQFLLKTLQKPWHDVTVDPDVVIEASTTDEHHHTEKKHLSGSPHGSPVLKSSLSPADGNDDDGDQKRAVLLCFNENVRSAEDVFLCHNEFIRDTANASKLQLTASEWRIFFGKDSGRPSLSAAAGSSKFGAKEDFLGEMNEAELNLFRTSWCSKRYDHEHDLCGFCHIEVSGGWLRRSPVLFSYRPEMCRDIIAVQDEMMGSTKFFVNQCHHGTKCPMAHSKEEIIYHPSSYKNRICKASSQAHGCALGDVCPDLHQHDLPHNIKKPSNDYRASHQRHNSTTNNNNNNNANRHHGHQQAGSANPQHGQHSGGGAHQGHRGGMTGVTPIGAPMLYVSPAPCSQFEKHLHMPGLQNLFRRHCSVIRAHLRSPVQKCHYSNFGDDWGIGTGLKFPEPPVKQQLPSPRS